MNNKIYQGQSYLDKVMELTGSAENAFEMAILNGRSITDDVVIGQELKSSAVTRKRVVALFNGFNRPATDIRNSIAIQFEYELPGEFPLSF